ncbi:uncharacterized protein LOC124451076 [Xenia sp. Carnegie-2017]|uniref:uncharacterized protein LOC124451076 n=1 Tax=Xenia sp. Carnegie-2017 TaxID=2897299 RepID=UPI001F04D99F|nr:uncharacterized protein LOC124451076 [Xenia sp. Carnegie-2017]
MTDNNCNEKVNIFCNQNDISENGIQVESRRELNPVDHMRLPIDDVPVSEANTELIYVDKQMDLPNVDIPVHAESELVPGDQHMNPPEDDIPVEASSEIVSGDQHMNPPEDDIPVEASSELVSGDQHMNPTEVDIPVDSGSEFVSAYQHINPHEDDIRVDPGNEFVSGEQRMNFPDFCISVEASRLELNVHDTETQNIISVDELKQPNSLVETEEDFSQGEQNSESMYLGVGLQVEDIGEEEVMFHDMNEERGTLLDSRVLVAENWSIEEETRDQPMNFHHTETQNIILVDESDQPSLLGEIEAHLQGELNSELMQLYVSLLIEDMREEEVMFDDMDEEMGEVVDSRDLDVEFCSSVELDCPLTTPEV